MHTILIGDALSTRNERLRSLVPGNPSGLGGPALGGAFPRGEEILRIKQAFDLAAYDAVNLALAWEGEGAFSLGTSDSTTP